MPMMRKEEYVAKRLIRESMEDALHWRARKKVLCQQFTNDEIKKINQLIDDLVHEISEQHLKGGN